MTYLFGTNLDIKDAKDELKSLRFLTAVDGIKKFMSAKNKVAILSHQGRPKEGDQSRDKKLSLKHFVKPFEKKLKKKVIFVDNDDLDKTRKTILAAKPGSILLLENVRFLKGESDNDPNLAKKMASLGDVYIDDDFATAHRENASNVGITKFIPSRMGPNFKREVTNLSRAIQNPKSPFLLILGGAKMADKMGVINNLLPKLDYILVGGGVANTFLKASGMPIGNSLYEEEMVEEAKKLLTNKKIVMPVDYARSGEGKILDIGPETAKLYSEKILKAKTIIWGGPLGYIEDKEFARGSTTVAKAIAKSRGFSIVGGGETAQIITDLKLNNQIDLVSTGGGAMLEFLAGKRMPAIEALKENNHHG